MLPMLKLGPAQLGGELDLFSCKSFLLTIRTLLYTLYRRITGIQFYFYKLSVSYLRGLPRLGADPSDRLIADWWWSVKYPVS
jgi:hypothetical protein